MQVVKQQDSGHCWCEWKRALGGEQTDRHYLSTRGVFPHCHDAHDASDVQVPGAVMCQL